MEKNPCGVRKGKWTQEEDSLLKKCIKIHGEGKWHLVPIRAGLNRCRKSCRLRWLNYLKPTLKRGQFSTDEVDLLIRLHKLLGNRWSLIAGRLPGRTSNDVKNFWNTHIQKKQFLGETVLVQVNVAQKCITYNNIERPKPRTINPLSGSTLQPDFNVTEDSNKIPSSSDECITLWNNLLQMSTGAGPSTSGVGGVVDADHNSNPTVQEDPNVEDGFMADFSIGIDVWELLNFEDI